MKKFHYGEEFNRVSDVVRFGGTDDVRISYGVFVGDPNGDDKGFLGTNFFSADDFTTWNDAAKAKLLVLTVLEHVDKHEQKNNATITTKVPRDIRLALYRCIENTVDKMLEFSSDKHFGAMLTAELIYNLNNVLAENNTRPLQRLERIPAL